MAHSDFRTNAQVRQVLARHWIDLHEIRFGCFRGTVRFHGRLCHLNGRVFENGGEGLVELLEAEVKRIAGVRAVFFDFVNWIRDSTGSWTAVMSDGGVPVSEEEAETLEFEASSQQSETTEAEGAEA